MAKRIIIAFLVVVAGAALATGGFVSGLSIGKQLPETLILSSVSDKDIQEASSLANFAQFWEVWKTIDEYYLRSKEVSGNDKVLGSIRGLVGSLGDPHSEFFTPSDNQKFQEDIRGNFGGIGAEIGIRDERLIVVAPLQDSPAMRAGLLPGDHIVRVDDTPTEGMGVQEAVKIIRGQENTVVVLLVLRGDWTEPRAFRITRATITVPTLDFEMIGTFAHIKLHSFNAVAEHLFARAVDDARRKGAEGIILDMRNNPGGFLDVAVDLGGWFFEPGSVVVSEEGIGDARQELQAQGNALLKDMPIVVLVNAGSASASEILAGALRDIRGIKLVGEKTFGKGTVQQLVDLRGGASIKLTIAQWVLPSGKILEGEGLEPDVAVAMTEEDIKKGDDPQLLKAIEALRGEIAKP